MGILEFTVYSDYVQLCINNWESLQEHVGVKQTEMMIVYGVYIYIYIHTYIYIYIWATAKIKVMKSSIWEVSFFENWAEAWKTIRNSPKNDNMCRAFTICLRDKQAAKCQSLALTLAACYCHHLGHWEGTGPAFKRGDTNAIRML